MYISHKTCTTGTHNIYIIIRDVSQREKLKLRQISQFVRHLYHVTIIFILFKRNVFFLF